MNALALLLALNGTAVLWALDPNRALTQYSKTTWTQQQGLPQDTIRVITQTRDGFLWLGTDEGITRFDGYEFTTYGRTQIGLPSNSVTALAAGPDGSLWIGTPAGLAQWKDGHLQTFTRHDGLIEDSISALLVDHAGVLWIVAAGKLDGPVTCHRNWVDLVVTEHGVADLRGAGVLERARRLIAIADPQHQDALAECARRIYGG